jgi:hypothetical protein
VSKIVSNSKIISVIKDGSSSLIIKKNVEDGRTVFVVELYYKDKIIDNYRLNQKELTRRDPMQLLNYIAHLVYKFKTDPMTCLNPSSTT